MIEPSGEHYAKYLEITERIDAAIDCVNEATAMHSGKSKVYTHPEFHWLVEQGDKIIPYLFHKMTQHGSNWVILLLLNKIAPVNPILPEHRGSFPWMIYDWLGWYLTSEYRERDDIYCGLIPEYEPANEI